MPTLKCQIDFFFFFDLGGGVKKFKQVVSLKASRQSQAVFSRATLIIVVSSAVRLFVSCPE